MLRHSALLGLLAALLVSAGCAAGRAVEIATAPVATVAALVEARVAAEHTSAEALKTSKDATQAAQEARQEARAARALADEKDGEAKRLEGVAEALRRAEIAHQIAIYGWCMIISGALGSLVGAFLVIRLGGKTAWTVLLIGAGTLALGLVALVLAPHWVLVAWSAAIVSLLILAGGLAYLLHGHQTALASLYHKTQDEAMADPKLRRLLGRAGIKPP